MAHSPSLRVARRPLRVGVAGLGAVAQAVHLPLLARLPGTFELAAICDLSSALTTALGERYRIPAQHRYRDVTTMLDSVELDGLIVLTSGSHGDVALAALERGLPVLSEKPLATTRAEADRLAAVEGPDHDGERLMVGYMKLFDPAVEEAVRVARGPGCAHGGVAGGRGDRPASDEREPARARPPAAATRRYRRHDAGGASGTLERARYRCAGRRGAGTGPAVQRHPARQRRP